MTDLLGRASSAVLLATLVRQVLTQWREGTSEGVSRWLFVGQTTASLGLAVHSLPVRNWVFAVTNALLLTERRRRDAPRPPAPAPGGAAGDGSPRLRHALHEGSAGRPLTDGPGLADNPPTMLLGKSSTGAKRWPRGQKFQISPSGAAAEAAYRAAVLGARSSGRATLDAALAAWAAPRSVAPADGVILSELAGKRLGVAELCDALDGAGIAPEEVRAGIARLVAAGIIEAVPLHPAGVA